LSTISHIEASRMVMPDIGMSRGDQRRTSAFSASGRRDSERMYRRAIRHSRAVRTLRLTIPLTLVIGSFVGIVIATALDPLRALAKLPVDAQGLVVSGTKITMQQPRLAGFTKDSRPYVVNARAATQDLLKPDLLELEDIHSTLNMPDKTKFDLTARHGLYDTKAEKLTLQTDIVVVTDRYRAFLSEALVNVKAGHVVTERPVRVIMMQGTVNGNRMEMFNSGEIIRFERGVTMVVNADGSNTQGRTEGP
jgi:lipopolysaccharide export system protein LptC